MRDETKKAFAVEEQAAGPELGKKLRAGRHGGGTERGKREKREREKIDFTAIEEQILAGPCAGPATVRF